MSQTASHLAGAAIGADPVPPRPSRATRRATGFGDTIFAALCQGAGILVLLLLGAIIVELFLGGLPAFRAFGLAFVASTDWDPVQEVFGGGVPIYGTLLTALLAILMAVPAAFGIAFFLTELAPDWMRRPVGVAVELLAAVPRSSTACGASS